MRVFAEPRDLYTREVLDAVPRLGIHERRIHRMTLSCDARLAAEAAEVILPENGLGLTISNGASYLLTRLLGARALPLVLSSPRLSAREALELGLVDELVPAARDVVAAAVERVLGWTDPGQSTHAHLTLLRPPRHEVEAAMRRETSASRAAWDSGVSPNGVRDFLASLT